MDGRLKVRLVVLELVSTRFLKFLNRETTAKMVIVLSLISIIGRTALYVLTEYEHC